LYFIDNTLLIIIVWSCTSISIDGPAIIWAWYMPATPRTFAFRAKMSWPHQDTAAGDAHTWVDNVRQCEAKFIKWLNPHPIDVPGGSTTERRVGTWALTENSTTGRWIKCNMLSLPSCRFSSRNLRSMQTTPGCGSNMAKLGHHKNQDGSCYISAIYHIGHPENSLKIRMVTLM